MINILFVCLGNICRSPLAEGLFGNHCHQHGLDRGFTIDSAGTGDWHIGKPPDSRAIQVATEFQLDISSQRARQIRGSDFQNFEWIIAMDRNNLIELESLATNYPSHARIALLSSLISKPGFIDVPDPWFGNYNDFQHTASLLDRACCKLFNELFADD